MARALPDEEQSRRRLVNRRSLLRKQRFRRMLNTRADSSRTGRMEATLADLNPKPEYAEAEEIVS
jgi:hypothetical protein